MIQRIQTLLLLLATIAAGLLLWEQLALCNVDMESIGNIGKDSPLRDGKYDVYDSPISAALVGLVLILNIVAISLFKNRPKQILFTWISLVLMVIFSVFMGVWFYMTYTTLPAGCEVSPGPGIALPVLTIIFLFIAIRRIGADEELVRSMDRLR